MSKHRLLIIGLILSVGINLFLLGGIGMRMRAVEDFREARPFPPNIGWIVRDLSEDRQAELGSVLQPLGEEISPLRRAMFDAQRRVNQLMTAEDYQAAALETAFANLRAASEAYTSLSHQQTVTVLNLLTEEERQAAVEFVQRRGPRDGRDGARRSRSDGAGFPPPGGPDGRSGPDGGRPPPPNGGPDRSNRSPGVPNR